MLLLAISVSIQSSKQFAIYLQGFQVYYIAMIADSWNNSSKENILLTVS